MRTVYKAEGYSAILEPETGCSCDFNEVAPCGYIGIGCVPAYKHELTSKQNERYDGCTWVATTRKKPPTDKEVDKIMGEF